MANTVNVWNDFYPQKFNEVCERLESGEEVSLFVDCIGHTRNNMVQNNYRSKLVEKYGDRLEYKESGGNYSYSYTYKLKEDLYTDEGLYGEVTLRSKEEAEKYITDYIQKENLTLKQAMDSRMKFIAEHYGIDLKSIHISKTLEEKGEELLSIKETLDSVISEIKQENKERSVKLDKMEEENAESLEAIKLEIEEGKE